MALSSHSFKAKTAYTLFGLVLLAALAYGIYTLRQQSSPVSNTHNKQPAHTKSAKQPQSGNSTSNKFNKHEFSLDEAHSPWVVVNKKRALKPTSYTPANLVTPAMRLRGNITASERLVTAETAAALQNLDSAAKAAGHTLTLESGYRSYNFQAALYNRYVKQQGQSVADTQSARAGHSEHQTGLAADLGGITKPACNVEACFADTPEGQWLAAHAHEHGFIIRYPSGKTPVTGYTYEPWHLRYVGMELAAEMHHTDTATMEEFFGLPAAPDYN